jgi:hypothetical protein
MINQESISLERLKTLPNESFKTIGASGGLIPATGRLIASNDDYRLYYALDLDAQLESGAEINDTDGFLITRKAYNSNGNLRQAVTAVAFYPVIGMYSNYSLEDRETVIMAYNGTIEGEEAQTTDTIEETPSLNAEGETVAEQRAREEAEAAAEKEQAEIDARTAVNKEVVIREESVNLSYDGSTLNRTTTMKIIEITTGTVANPIVTYRVEEINPTAAGFIAPIWVVETETQEAAEAAFDGHIEKITSDFNVEAEIDKQNTLANTPKLERFENVEFYFEEADITFQEALTGPIEDSPLWKRVIGRGNYDDAAVFTNGGNTLELDDFDTPRFTTEGYTENKSGAVGFTIRKNWKVTFEIETDSTLRFIERNAVEGVETSGNTFTFTMYAGDRLEVDIDNERGSIRPFLVMVQGREWFSAEEADDEISITMIKAEKLMVNYESGSEYVLPDGTLSDTLPRVVENEYVGPAWTTEMSLSFYRDSLEANPEYMELNYVERPILSQQVAAEDSFVSAEELVIDPVVDAAGDAADAAGDAVKSVWDSIKWWLLGGVVVVVAVGLLVVYVNGRSRSTQVVQASPVSEA